MAVSDFVPDGCSQWLFLMAVPNGCPQWPCRYRPYWLAIPMKISNLPWYRFWLSGLLLVSLMGCRQSSPSSSLVSFFSELPGLSWLKSVTPIAEVTTETSQTAVFLQGQVQQHIPLLNQWLYQLQDPSGKIWVLTTTPPPEPGETLLIQVRIHYESILLQGNDIGEFYGEELQRQVIPPEASES